MTHAHAVDPRGERTRGGGTGIRRDDARSRARAQDQVTGRGAIAVAGLATSADEAVVRRDFDFAWDWRELTGYDADVKQAIAQAKGFAGAIATARAAIEKLKTASVRAAGLDELADVERFLKAWNGTKVPVDQRAAVVGRIAEIAARLPALVGDFAQRDRDAIAEARRLAQEQTQREKEARKQRHLANEQQRKNDKEQDARRAEQAKQDAADQKRQKIAGDVSTLTDRGVLPEAQNAAKEEAARDTESAKRASDSANARLGKKGTSNLDIAAAAARKQELETQVEESTNASMGAMAQFARSPEGMALSQADLGLVLRIAGPDSARARALVQVIDAAGTDRTVVSGFAGVRREQFGVVAGHCVTLLGKGVPAASVLDGARAMAADGEVRGYLSSASDQVVRSYLTTLSGAGPHALKAALARDLPNQPTGSAYTAQVAKDLLSGLKAKAVSPEDIAWLVARAQEPEFAGLTALFLDQGVDIQALRAVFAATGYTAAETLTLCQAYKDELAALRDVIGDAQVGCPGYTRLRMQMRHLQSFSAPQQKAALRAEALLAAGLPGVTLAAYRAPGDFGRGDDNAHRATNIAREAKTGFLRLTFAAPAEVHEIHTHWFQADGKGVITSMHVETAGVNGIEIQTLPVLSRLVAAVVAVHNADNRFVKPSGQSFRV